VVDEPRRSATQDFRSPSVAAVWSIAYLPATSKHNPVSVRGVSSHLPASSSRGDMVHLLPIGNELGTPDLAVAGFCFEHKAATILPPRSDCFWCEAATAPERLLQA
jgi:hypothetical protein